MGERWIQECAEHLKQIKEALVAEDPDRLDLVKAMHTALLALNHSVWGWLQYVNNPDIMGKFDRGELDEISGFLNKFAEDFIEYDIKVTKDGMKKGLSEVRQREQDQQLFYV
ncbi:hypothetical protein AC482_01890 [miscellaneous Crenarchaeota group-15 archaeon DG-45]|uniref:DUF2153 domain-containing protein n=1 Tax=miscellaneous Crenarchaeota group-15 archaeon DG-45 TaxID=1685127 RepID=A0A0M0BRU3_9ARCH|nr:MAG: hypothetical protein AC482_01890 [miscellaneous Crenarchaeota group-15 archaeon DG-45]